jgi:hypothetical protein
MLKFLVWGMLFASALYAQLQPPQALTVVSATNRQVQFKWTPGDSNATGYVIERKLLGSEDSTYSTAVSITAPATTTGTDGNIDPYTAYVYRVRGTLQGNSSGASNTVTVGPPPYGYNTVVPYPADHDPYFAGQFGQAVRMILDSSGDPALAYVWADPNNVNDFSTSSLNFARWDRAHYQWTSPVKVTAIGDVQFGSLFPISLAQDASSGTFGIAYQDETGKDSAGQETSRIGVALSSDGGLTWKTVKAAAEDGAEGYQRPSMAMSGGNLHLAFYHDYDGIRYVTGKETDDPSKWTSTLVPLPGGYTYYTQISSLALDSKGAPAIAFIVSNDNGPAEAFWHPGGSTVLIRDDAGMQNDSPDLSLVFFGTQPRVVFAGALDNNYYDDYDHTMWVISSPDNGTTWSNPSNVTSDQGSDLNGPLSLALGSRGQAALAMESNGGNGTAYCGGPKLAMSTDLVTWTTCGLSTVEQPDIDGGSPNVAYAGNDRLFLGFRQSVVSDTSLPLGITVWRQPPGWAFPPPPSAISGRSRQSPMPQN